MDPKERTSRRLKAARWLLGDTRNQKGQVVPLPVTTLAQLPQLQRNKITASRLEEIEQENICARDMELRVIADALGLPGDWFAADEPADLFTTGQEPALARLEGGLSRLEGELRRLREDLLEQELEARDPRSLQRAGSSEPEGRGQDARG